MMNKPAAIGFGPSPVLKGAGLSPAVIAKARANSQDFEAMFLNSMFGQMFSNVGDGPFSGGQAAKTWQSMLTDEYAKNVAKSGGVGLADSVFKELIAQQEARAK
jgi:peptidoglycan hydrolase FlgJ